jgi:uncharacterized protein YjiS (DUF1127 family)
MMSDIKTIRFTYQSGGAISCCIGFASHGDPGRLKQGKEHQMAQYLHRSAGSLRSALSFIHDAGLALAAAVNAIVNRYEAGRALARLDSRMLADIGLTENDVGSAFAEPLWRDPTRRLAVISIERRTAMRAARRKPAAAERKNAPEVVLH